MTIHDRIGKLEEALRGADDLPAASRDELLQLVAELRQEVEPLADSHGEDAGSIAAFTEVSLLEARRRDKRPKLSEAALHGLSSSVEGFEITHPRLVDVVNRIALALANMGI